MLVLQWKVEAAHPCGGLEVSMEEEAGLWVPRRFEGY